MKTIQIVVTDDGKVGLNINGFSDEERGDVVNILIQVLAKITPGLVEEKSPIIKPPSGLVGA